MANSVIYAPIFIRKLRTLGKKHSSLIADVEELEKSVIINPIQGDDFGGGLRKLRLSVKKVRVKARAVDTVL